MKATLAPGPVTVHAECVKVEGRRISFDVKAHDGVESIGEGRHQRYVVHWDKFNERLHAKMVTVDAHGA